MRIRFKTGALLSLCLLAASAGARAQILGTTARQLPKGSLKLLAYYQGTQGQQLNFTIANAGNCSTANGLNFGCGQTGDSKGYGNGGMGVLKLVYQPWESVQYYGGVGVGDYSLQVPFNGVTSTLSGDKLGVMGFVGLRSTIYPDTQFTPAIAVDASIAKSRYDFNRRFPGAGLAGENDNINQNLNLTQYQVGVEISHVFVVTDAAQKTGDKEAEGMLPLTPQGFEIEPYGGVKWTRIQADLHDLQDGSHAGGQQDQASPFAGVRIPIYGNEALWAESSFVGGYQYAGGLEIRFK